MLFIFTAIESKAQLCQSPCPYYKDFIRLAQADTVKNTQEKLNYYRAAIVAAKDCNCSELEQSVNKQIDTLFIIIEAQKKMAEAQSYTILEQQKKIEIAFEKAEIANEKNEKIVSAMDFYDGKFALAIKDGKYGFIDKNGNANRNINFIYDKGEPFNSKTGFAKMEINIYDNLYKKYLIDTSGNKYRLINILEVLREEGIVKSILSKKEIAYLKEDLTENMIRSKLKKMELYTESVNKKLRSEMNRSRIEIALDFEGMDKDDILNILEFLAKDSILRDRVELLLFSGLDLDVFPSSIIAFKNLKEINIVWTEITSLPSTISKLKKLKVLRLPSSVNKVPSSLYDLESLEWLDLSLLNITALPGAIGKLKNLKVIHLPLFLEKLPASFSKLENLEYLNFHTARLTTFPEAIGKLKKLKELTLPKELEALPASICNLENLESLVFPGDNPKVLPEAIGNLKSLKKIALPGGLEKLPASIFSLEKLENLIIYSRVLTELPEAIGNLKNLKRLFSYASVEQLPASLGDLENLEFLALVSKNLKMLPDTIGNLKNLEELDLSKTAVTMLPETIRHLTKLKILKLPPSLEKLPKGISNLKNLEALDLSKTVVKELPETIGNLTFLKNLRLPPLLETFPKGISNLKYLETLEFNNPLNIGNLPDISNLKKLYRIYFKLHNDENYAANLKILEELQEKIPNVRFTIKDEKGKKIKLSETK